MDLCFIDAEAFRDRVRHFDPLHNDRFGDRVAVSSQNSGGLLGPLRVVGGWCDVHQVGVPLPAAPHALNSIEACFDIDIKRTAWNEHEIGSGETGARNMRGAAWKIEKHPFSAALADRSSATRLP